MRASWLYHNSSGISCEESFLSRIRPPAHVIKAPGRVDSVTAPACGPSGWDNRRTPAEITTDINTVKSRCWSTELTPNTRSCPYNVINITTAQLVSLLSRQAEDFINLTLSELSLVGSFYSSKHSEIIYESVRVSAVQSWFRLRLKKTVGHHFRPPFYTSSQ